jgi:hypothetical protein
MGKRSKKNRKKSRRRTDLSVTSLQRHQKIGKNLVPPFAQMRRQLPVQPANWPGERLPEMLWAAMLIAGLGRSEALSRLRRLAVFIKERCDADETHRQTLCQVTLTGLAGWNEQEFDGFVQAAIQGDGALFAILLRFDNLPAKERWQKIAVHDGESFDILKAAVGTAFWHQSQEATDCRWMRVFAMLASGSLLFPQGAEDKVREIVEYPDYGDQRGVRPSIRALEGAADGTKDGFRVSAWSPSFWKQAYEFTRNDHARFSGKNPVSLCALSLDDVRCTREALGLHSEATTTGTAVDPRHEAAFGFSGYALDLLIELLSVGNSSRILGRMALRSLAELLINFTMLAKHDELERWQRFRDYGYGQAKLAYLKMLETETLPSFVAVEWLEALANEDMWHEFREMRIGNWDDSDLRKMSEATGIKEDVYDRYYDWSSAFVHANWAALRDAEYDLCLNPLHRFHRILSTQTKSLPDVIGDAVHLVNKVLEVLDGLYPSFPNRLPASKIDASETV